MLGWGASRVVIGSAAAVDATLVARLLARHGADRLAVGIDARDGRLAARGSTTVIDLAPVELARRVQALGARTVIYTDAARDGTLTGPDLVGARAIAALGLDVIVSGGVAWLDDLRRAADAGLAAAAARGGSVTVVSDGAIPDLADIPPDLARQARIVLLPRAPFFDAFVASVDGPRRVAAGDTVRLKVSYGTAGMRDARSGMRDAKPVVAVGQHRLCTAVCALAD